MVFCAPGAHVLERTLRSSSRKPRRLTHHSEFSNRLLGLNELNGFYVPGPILRTLCLLSKEEPPNRPSPKRDRNSEPDDTASKEGAFWLVLGGKAFINFCLSFDDFGYLLILIQNPTARGYGHG
jgi:hypothetical protein